MEIDFLKFIRETQLDSECLVSFISFNVFWMSIHISNITIELKI